MEDLDWLGYFSGGIPAGEYLRLTLNDIGAISRARSVAGEDPSVSPLQSLCFVGAFSYFEAFCKDHFASLINIEPSLVSNLKDHGQNVFIDATHVVLYGEDVQGRIGFILAEKFDFGTAQKINAIFSALLRVTPFSKGEIIEYSRLLGYRNLIVHHGGTYTLSYVDQVRDSSNVVKGGLFNPKRKDVLAAIKFLKKIARKLMRGTHQALVEYVVQEQQGPYNAGRKKALEALLWWQD
jgi:hypothetical protein